MKRINLRFLIVLVALVAALGGGSLVAYKIQRKRSVEALLAQAKAAEKAGDRVKADGLYAHYLGFRGDDNATMADYGLMLAGDANTREARAKALSVLAQVVRRDPGRADVRREVVRIAMDRTVRQYAQALEQLEALMAASPDDGRLEFQAAQCLEGGRKYPEAVEMYSKATAHAPDQADAYVRLAGLLRARLAKPAEADKVLDRLVEHNPGSFRAYLERGKQRLAGGAKGAEQDIARALELAPDDVDVLAMAAELALGRGNVDDARPLVARCLKARGKEARFHDLAYRIELRAGRNDEAEAILREGIEGGADPDGRIVLLVDLADLQIKRGNYPEAGKTIGRMGEARVRPELVKYYEARVVAGEGRWREAAGLLDDVRAALATPDNPRMASEAELLLARCRERLGETDRRCAALQRALALTPRDLQARQAFAEALAASGRLDEAVLQYQDLEADAPQTRTALARLLIIRNLQRPPAGRDWAEVDKILASAESAAPGTLEVQLLRAEALAGRDRLNEARKELVAAAGRFPGREAPSVALAGLALREGRPGVASEVLDRADRELGDRAALRLARADAWVARGGDGAVGALQRLAEGTDRLPETDRPTLLRGLAEAHRRLGDLPGARRILDRLGEQAPDDFALQLARFELAFQSDDGEGMKSIIGAIGDKDEVAALLARARYLAWSASRESRRGDAARASLDQARQLLGQAEARRPGWLPVVFTSACVDDLAGDPDRAIRGFLQAIELGERTPAVGLRAIELLASQGRHDQADEVVRKMLGDAATPKQPGLYRLAAEVAMRVKDPARALEYGAKAVATASATPGDRLWRGRLLWAAGKAPQAEPDLRAAASTAGDPEAPAAWATLVAYLAATGRRAAAEEAIEQARRKLPDRARPLALARCFAAIDRPDRAQEQYRAAVAASPQDLETLGASSDIALGIGKFEDAKDYLRKLVARQADEPEVAAKARRILGVLLAASGDRRQVRESLAVMGLVEDGLPNRPAAKESTEDLRAKANVLALRGGRPNRRAALEALRTIIGRGKPSPDDRFLIAQVLEIDGDWPKSREQIRLALADSGDNPAYLAFYIRGLLRHEGAGGVRPWLEKLEKVDPSSLQAAELKARLALAEDRPGEASRLLGDFARARPGSTVQVALLLESLGRPDDAEGLFRGLASREKRPEADLTLAAFLGRRNRVPEALDLCDRAWKSGPLGLASQASVAVLYASMAGEKDCQRVADRMEDAIRRSPDDVQLRFDLANVQILREKYQDAEAVFRRIYEKDKENSASANNLAWLLSIQDGKASEAIALVDRAIELSGPLPMLLDTRGMARVAVGQDSAAIEDLEEATNSGPTAERYFHLALAYLKGNRPKDAKEALREAKVLGLDEGKLHPREREDYRRLLGELPGR